MRITRVGLDLAKRVFQVHGVDEHGRARVDKKLSRGQVRPFFAQLSPGVIGIEASGGAHYWERELGKFGHTATTLQWWQESARSNHQAGGSISAHAADAGRVCSLAGWSVTVLTFQIASVVWVTNQERC